MNIHLKFKKKHFYLLLVGLIVFALGIFGGAYDPLFSPDADASLFGHSANELDVIVDA